MEKQTGTKLGSQKEHTHTYWNTLNSLNNKKTPEQTNKIINFNNKPAQTPQEKANAFNNQFVNTVKHATKRTNRKINRHTKKLPHTPIIITPQQTTQAIKAAKNNNSTGPDNINIRHLKHLGPLAINYLTQIFNLSLNQNIIPQIWKLAKIIPIPKPNKDPGIGTSYRPISLLSPIAKIMEKIILPHITENIQINPHQHGFKTHHSTTTALHQLTNQITKGFNKLQPPDRTIIVSLDLSKAFDTVNIHTLIYKHTYHPSSSNTSQTTSKAGKDTHYTSMHHSSRPQEFKT